MPGSDPTHWLHRLDAAEWLAAADTELRHCAEMLSRRGFRAGITHARRAAGMACNAILVGEEHPAWGRSYMEHVVALAGEEGPIGEAAKILRDTPPAPPELVTLGKPDLSALEAARAIVEWARDRVAR